MMMTGQRIVRVNDSPSEREGERRIVRANESEREQERVKKSDSEEE